MSATQIMLLIGVLVALLVVVATPWLLAQRRRQDAWSTEDAYLDTIDALIRGDRPAAAESLRRVAEADPENIVAYLRLGDLVRAMGHADRAHKIHFGLTARPIESARTTQRVQESLLLDLIALRRWDELIRAAERLKATSKKNPAAPRALTIAYEATQRWELAFAAADDWERLAPGQARPRPYQLRIRAAEAALQKDQPNQARQLLDTAAKFGATSAEIGILQGDVLAREGHHEAAAAKWLEFARSAPERANEVFHRLERSYYEMGKFGDLLEVYEALARENDAAPAQVALADLHVRRGRTEEALHLLQSVLASHPESTAAQRLLVQCYLEGGQVEAAARSMREFLDHLDRNGRRPDGARSADDRRESTGSRSLPLDPRALEGLP